MSYTTTNLAEFGYRELTKVRDLLTAMIDAGLPDDFYDYGVVPMFNKHSGCVFLTNSEYQTAMLNGEKLETWYFLSYHGNEGFAEDLYIDFKNGNIGSEDYAELADILERNHLDAEAEEVWLALEIIDSEEDE